MANPTAINPNAIDAAAAIASNVQWPSPPVNSLSLIARWCCSRRDQHVSMDELQSHVMPYARPRAAVATQFNVVEVPGKRECGPPASWIRFPINFYLVKARVPFPLRRDDT